MSCSAGLETRHGDDRWDGNEKGGPHVVILSVSKYRGKIRWKLEGDGFRVLSLLNSTRHRSMSGR